MGFVVFALAFLLRLLFWQATPDADWSYPALYRGDVPVWTQWASAIAAGESYENGIPLRPPGAAYLFALLGGTSIRAVAGLRLLWCILGSLTVLLFFKVVHRSWGLGPAALFGLLCAGSTGLMVLSISPNNETVYLLIVAMTFLLWRSVDEGRAWRPWMIWSGLHGLACLVRAEHVLFYLLCIGLLGIRLRRRERASEIPVKLAFAILPFALVLLPWQVKMATDIGKFNDGDSKNPAATEEALRQIEQATQGIQWSPEALEEVSAYPATSRRPAAGFVAATVAARGRRAVRSEDLAILDEAFGYRPEKLSQYPFVALYGGLNFYLANSQSATGGFDRSPLELPPRLSGGPSKYPRALIAGLPPAQLALAYPPHLQAVNEGYRLGWASIRDNPRRSLVLAGKKLRIFASGMTLGFGGWNFPLGFDGKRRSVDLAVPADGFAATGFALSVLLVSAWGLMGCFGDRKFTPWLLFLAYRLVIATVFYGYSRHGALVIPVLVLLLVKLVPIARARPPRWFFVGAFLLLGAELVRWAVPPVVLLDGQTVTQRQPGPLAIDDSVEHSVEIIWPRPD